MSLKWPPKDPDETLDYTVDWTRFLRAGETISSVAWYINDASGVKQAVTSGSTVNAIAVAQTGSTGTTATIYLSGGTNNTQYTIFCAVTLSSGVVAERSITLSIKER